MKRCLSRPSLLENQKIEIRNPQSCSGSEEDDCTVPICVRSQLQSCSFVFFLPSASNHFYFFSIRITHISLCIARRTILRSATTRARRLISVVLQKSRYLNLLPPIDDGSHAWKLFITKFTLFFANMSM